MSAPTKKQIALAVLELSKKNSSKKVVNQLAAYLSANHRSSELEPIMKEVAFQREKIAGISELNVSSAFDITDSFVKELADHMGIKKYVSNKLIDKNLIGGVRVEASGKELDLSVRNRLEKLKGAKT